VHPGVEAARLAACLVYAGHAAEAQGLLRAAWPEGAPGLAETERQLAARIACSPFVAAVRAVNAPARPLYDRGLPAEWAGPDGGLRARLAVACHAGDATTATVWRRRRARPARRYARRSRPPG
jgi:hypothetical protein